MVFNAFTSLIGLCLFFLFSCKSRQDIPTSEASSSNMEESSENSRQTKDFKLETRKRSAEQALCTVEYNPTRCAVSGSASQELTEASHVYAWGSNLCHAQNKLNEELTHSRYDALDHSSLDKPVCTPDVSLGACSELIENCKEGAMRSARLFCRIQSLDGFPLREDEIVYALGTEECDAKTLAKIELCKRNLYHIKLKITMQCLPVEGEVIKCHNPELEICPKAYRPHVCEAVNVSAESHQFISFGHNECLARKTLERRLCFAKPKSFSDVKILCRGS